MSAIKEIIDISKKKLLYLDEEIKRLSQKTLVLFGAGAMSNYVVNSIRSQGLNPVCFCDNNLKKVGTNISGIPVISFKELCDKHKSSNIYITSTFYYNDIKKELLDNGFFEENISGFDLVHFFPWEKDYINCLVAHEKDFQDLFSLLADDKSKEVLLKRLNFLISRERSYMTDIRTPNQYFEKGLINLSHEEIFIDLGAFDGDSIRSFILACEGKYKKIYALEPENENYNKLINCCKDYSNIAIFKAGAWNMDGSIPYSSICDVSAITLAEDSLNFDNNCNDKIGLMDTRSVDSILKGQPATFIKMDIVGVEKKALDGCKRTIQKYMPTLAVCVYHRATDIYTLPKYILELCPKYKIYLRHYSDGVSETVCYAIAD